MTTAKIDSKFSTQVGEALALHIDSLMAKLRAGRVETLHIVGTLVPSERTEPTPGEDKEPSVKLRLVSLEIPDSEQAEAVREVQRALWLSRTATGTLDEEGEVQLAKHTLKDAGGDIAQITAARLRAGVDQWAKEASKATTSSLSASEMWHEMERLRDGLFALLGAQTDEDDEQVTLDDL